jgi:hypothetical protein
MKCYKLSWLDCVDQWGAVFILTFRDVYERAVLMNNADDFVIN